VKLKEQNNVASSITLCHEITYNTSEKAQTMHMQGFAFVAMAATN